MVKVMKGQNLFDISIQEAGTIESLFDIAVANNQSVTDALLVDSVLEIPQEAIANKKTVIYFSTRGYHPATDEMVWHSGGIGYMAIDIDFIVS